MAAKRKKSRRELESPEDGYREVLASMVELLESARRASVRTVNCVMTATYWELGRRIVEFDQRGEERAGYGQALLESLSKDLTRRFGRGFSVRNLRSMRMFYREWPLRTTLSAEPSDTTAEIRQTLSADSAAQIFPLPWSHYLSLLRVKKKSARSFYEKEAIRGGWSARQLERQINSQFYDRTLLSKNKAAMLRKGQKPRKGDLVSPEEGIKDPLVLEFLDLKDEYSEGELEDALIRHLEEFLLELGSDFAFVGRQRRLRIGSKWYRIDLLFFHRRLRCLVVIDLKIGELDHADAGQMHMYLNYALKHWTNETENPPVGLILCAQNDQAVARYALEGLPNPVLAAEYKLALPDEEALISELEKTQQEFANTRRSSKAHRKRTE